MAVQTDKQTVLVTGASSGIGQGIAIAFGQKGANVIINFHSDEEGANDTLRTIEQAGGKGLVIKANVGNEEEVKQMFEKGLQKFGNLDVVIANAGIQQDNDFMEMTLDQWNK